MFARRLTQLTPYVPGEQPQDRRYIKLNTNENPYPPTPRIRQYLKTVDPDTLRRYPDPLMTDLRTAIADRYGLEPKNVFAGNGSDEVLSFAFYAFFDPADGLLRFPEHTYSFYPVYCNFYDIQYQCMPLADDYTIDLATYLQTPLPCGVIFPNPNAPTGIGLPLSDIGEFMAQMPADRVVIVDEAYVDFAPGSTVDLIRDYPNLLVVRTFSKSMSLAGMRIGFALGQEDLIAALFTTKDAFNSYPLDTLAQKIGCLALADQTHFETSVKRVCETRDRFQAELRALGWTVWPSQTNFVLAGLPGQSGAEVYQALKERGILVRFFNLPGLDPYVRITIGTDEQMEALLREIRKGL